MMNFCVGSSLTAKACILLDQQRKLAGCDSESDVLSASEPKALSTVALQMLNPNSDSTGDTEMKASARAFKDKARVVLAGKKATV